MPGMAGGVPNLDVRMLLRNPSLRRICRSFCFGGVDIERHLGLLLFVSDAVSWLRASVVGLYSRRPNNNLGFGVQHVS